jgi:hypothetical protein
MVLNWEACVLVRRRFISHCVWKNVCDYLYGSNALCMISEIIIIFLSTTNFAFHCTTNTNRKYILVNHTMTVIIGIVTKKPPLGEFISCFRVDL